MVEKTNDNSDLYKRQINRLTNENQTLLQHIKANQEYKQKVKQDYDRFVSQVNQIISQKDEKLESITKLAENFKKEAEKNRKYQNL